MKQVLILIGFFVGMSMTWDFCSSWNTARRHRAECEKMFTDASIDPEAPSCEWVCAELDGFEGQKPTSLSTAQAMMSKVACLQSAAEKADCPCKPVVKKK